MPDISNWNPLEDPWELFETRKDFSLMHDVADDNPQKLEELKALFMRVAEENKVLPHRRRFAWSALPAGNEAEYQHRMDAF